MNKVRGFSLVEISLVMGALIVLTSLIFMGYQNVSGKQRARAEVEDMKHVISEIKSMYLRAPKSSTIPLSTYPSIFPKHMLVREGSNWRAYNRYSGKNYAESGGIERVAVQFGDSRANECGTADKPFCESLVITWPLSPEPGVDMSISASECVAFLTEIAPFATYMRIQTRSPGPYANNGFIKFPAAVSPWNEPNGVQERISTVCQKRPGPGITRVRLIVAIPVGATKINSTVN